MSSSDQFSFSIILLFRSVKIGEDAKVTFYLTPRSAGDKTISARFISRELRDVDGYRKVRVSRNLDFISSDNLDDNFRRNTLA